MHLKAITNGAGVVHAIVQAVPCRLSGIVSHKQTRADKNMQQLQYPTCRVNAVQWMGQAGCSSPLLERSQRSHCCIQSVSARRCSTLYCLLALKFSK